MLNSTGGLTVVLELDREVTYTEVESALNGEGFVSSHQLPHKFDLYARADAANRERAHAD